MPRETIKVGNTYKCVVTVTSEDNSITNLQTTTEVVYQVAKSVDADRAYLTKRFTDTEITVDDPADMQVTITVPATDTRNLPYGEAYHEAYLTLSDGTAYTILSEKIDIEDRLIKEA